MIDKPHTGFKEDPCQHELDAFNSTLWTDFEVLVKCLLESIVAFPGAEQVNDNTTITVDTECAVGGIP